MKNMNIRAKSGHDLEQIPKDVGYLYVEAQIPNDTGYLHEKI